MNETVLTDQPDTPYVAASGRYDVVPYRRAGNSGVLLPAVSLGLWQNFCVNRSAHSQREIVLHAFDSGITHIDLANNYGPPFGAAESQFGQILGSDLRQHRDEMFVATKAGHEMRAGTYGDGGSRKHLTASLDQSLRRLGVDYVDVLYDHRPTPDTPLDETMGALAAAVTSGKALYVGISKYDPAQTAEAVRILDGHGVPLLLDQPRYSVFDRVAEGGLFDVLTASDVGSAIFSPLAQRLLTEKYVSGLVPADSRVARTTVLNSNLIDDAYLQRIRGP